MLVYLSPPVLGDQCHRFVAAQAAVEGTAFLTHNCPAVKQVSRTENCLNPLVTA